MAESLMVFFAEFDRESAGNDDFALRKNATSLS
jgi:hypothetical protein